MIDRAVSSQSLGVSPEVEESCPPDTSFAVVYRDHFSFIVNSLRRLAVHPSDLEDLAHDVFTTALRRRDSYDPSRPIRPWLFGIAYRVVSDFKRLARHDREIPLEQAPEPPDAARPADEAVASSRERQLVLAALARIELTRRGVFIMHDIEGRAVPEIAQALDIPVGTAYSRLRQARVDFSNAIRALLPGGPR